MLDLARVLLLGAWTGADTTALAQLMISQPLVAGWLAGAATGDPGAGLAVGILLQILWGGTLPLGGSSFPLSGPASAAGGALAAWGARSGGITAGPLTFPSAWPLAAALAAALVAGEVGGRGVTWLRRRRVARLPAALAAAEREDAGAIVRMNLRGALEDALLGLGTAALGLALGRGLLAAASARPALDPAWVALAVGGFGVGAGLGGERGSRRAVVLVSAALVGAAAWRFAR